MITDHRNVTITGGYWKKKMDLNSRVTMNAVYDRFHESGRIDAFESAVSIASFCICAPAFSQVAFPKVVSSLVASNSAPSGPCRSFFPPIAANERTLGRLSSRTVDVPILCAMFSLLYAPRSRSAK